MTTKNINTHAKFYVLLKQMGISTEDKRDFIIDYTDGVTDSLTELWEKYPAFYTEMIRHMEASVKQIKANHNSDELHKLRRQVFGAVGGWLKLVGRKGNSELIKSIACRSASKDNFNKLTKEELRKVSFTFSKAQKVWKNGNQEMTRLLNEQIGVN